jgi:hypothetical protein
MELEGRAVSEERDRCGVLKRLRRRNGIGRLGERCALRIDTDKKWNWKATRSDLCCEVETHPEKEWGWKVSLSIALREGMELEVSPVSLIVSATMLKRLRRRNGIGSGRIGPRSSPPNAVEMPSEKEWDRKRFANRCRRAANDVETHPEKEWNRKIHEKTARVARPS